jgi:hypothetical protein
MIRDAEQVFAESLMLRPDKPRAERPATKLTRLG